MQQFQSSNVPESYLPMSMAIEQRIRKFNKQYVLDLVKTGLNANLSRKSNKNKSNMN